MPIHYPTASEITTPNAEDENGEYWDPWVALGLRCVGYSSDVDQNAIDVLRGIRDKLNNAKIAARTGLNPAYVELLQGIFCGADWAEYGTSPRGCFAMADDFPRLIEAFEAYFERQWRERPAEFPSASTD